MFIKETRHIMIAIIRHGCQGQVYVLKLATSGLVVEFCQRCARLLLCSAVCILIMYARVMNRLTLQVGRELPDCFSRVFVRCSLIGAYYEFIIQPYK
jgi:hypothetical protein